MSTYRACDVVDDSGQGGSVSALRAVGEGSDVCVVCGQRGCEAGKPSEIITPRRGKSSKPEKSNGKSKSGVTIPDRSWGPWGVAYPEPGWSVEGCGYRGCGPLMSSVWGCGHDWRGHATCGRDLAHVTATPIVALSSTPWHDSLCVCMCVVKLRESLHSNRYFGGIHF